MNGAHSPSQTALWAALFFAVGTFLGRALGGLLQKLARSAGYPSSHYYSLEAGDRWLSSLPLVSHLLNARGTRCRRALALELATGIAFASSWIFCPPAQAACGCVLFLGLIGAACIDLDHMIIPDFFTIGLAIAGLILSAAVPALHIPGHFTLLSCMRSSAAAVTGLVVGSGLVLWLGLMGELVWDKEVLGFGDVKFVGAIGAFCGWQGAVFSLFGGAFIGLVVMILAAARQRISGRSSVQLFRTGTAEGGTAHFGWGAHFPFGPMLAVAGGLYFILLRGPVDRYLAQYLLLF
jgi:leader peptidase (prepilin peptidase) / N-methyltransferase